MQTHPCPKNEKNCIDLTLETDLMWRALQNTDDHVGYIGIFSFEAFTFKE